MVIREYLREPLIYLSYHLLGLSCVYLSLSELLSFPPEVRVFMAYGSRDEVHVWVSLRSHHTVPHYLFGNLSSSSSCSVLSLFFFVGRHFCWPVPPPPPNRFGRTVYTLRVVGTGGRCVVIVTVGVVIVVVGRCLIVTIEGVLLAVNGLVYFTVGEDILMVVVVDGLVTTG